MKRGGNSAAPTVLVVDDDPAVRNSLKFMLNIEGFEVRSYHDGAELLQDSHLPIDACLVIDQILPGMSGLDVVDAVRKRVGALPAILITTHLTEALRKRAVSLRVPIITKPLLDDVLLQAIRAAVGSSACGC
jgi:two-component system response regulator FixJ